MSSFRRKSKPFSDMDKGRRMMVVGGLILVLLGCLVLYSAMQNEEWTQDEPTQRKVFLLASLLLITSIALCYYALNGEEGDDKDWLEGEGLTAVKYGDYDSCKRCLVAVYPQRQGLNNRMEEQLLTLLNGDDPRRKSDKMSTSSKKESIQMASRSDCHLMTPNNASINSVSYSPTEKIPNNTIASCSNIVSYKNTEKVVEPPQETGKKSSLLVQLMPLLPLQLCETSLQDLRPRLEKATGKPQDFPLPLHRTRDHPNPFEDDQNADAG